MIDAHGLAQRYGRKLVLQDVTIQVTDGVTALLGPNGAGKTTLLTTIVGLRRPAAGTLHVLAVDMLGRGGPRAAAARLGFLPQTVGFPPGYRLRDYVGYAGWLKGLAGSDLAQHVEVALQRVLLSEHAGAPMKTLSGGMLRRAGIAQAIVAEPELLVLDEPAAGLDPQQRIELRRLMRTLAERATVLVSTHAVEDVRHIADQIVVLSEGRIVFTGSVAQLEAADNGQLDADTDLERGYLSVLRPRLPAGKP